MRQQENAHYLTPGRKGDKVVVAEITELSTMSVSHEFSVSTRNSAVDKHMVVPKDNTDVDDDAKRYTLVDKFKIEDTLATSFSSMSVTSESASNIAVENHTKVSTVNGKGDDDAVRSTLVLVNGDHDMDAMSDRKATSIPAGFMGNMSTGEDNEWSLVPCTSIDPA